jgi:hypothetical protein
MIKDTHQKIKAVRYCVALGFVPHMEVVVRFLADTSDSPCDLTDIDVLGIMPGAEAPSLRIIFDCKTLNKISPINRAFWAKGLMAVTHSSEAFVILGKPAIEAHRLAGNSFGVRLFSEPMFDKFATSASPHYLVANSYIENIDGWVKLADIRRNYPALSELLAFLNSTALLQLNGNQGVRNLMSHMRQVSGEMDPSKDLHRSVFKLALAQFSIFVNEMVRDFHNIFDSEADKAQFERTLRYYIWGGKDNYDLRQRLNTALKATRGVTETEPFEFPAWDRFVAYFRGCLDSPLSVSSTCLPIKDMAFRELTSPVADIDRRLATRLKANNRVRQFALAAVSYFCDASRVPRDFREFFSNEINLLIDRS